MTLETRQAEQLMQTATGLDGWTFRQFGAGKFSDVFAAEAGGRELVLRVGPPDDVLQLFYEFRMMRREPAIHERLLAEMPALRLTVLIGQYAQKYYLETRRRSLAETVQDWQSYLPDHFPLPHPSPRNIRWFRNNPWFESGVLPEFRRHIRCALK